MAVGFVLIAAAPQRENEVLDGLLQVPQIVDLHPLFGEYDLIAKVEAESFDALGRVIVERIRCLPGVTGTRTLTGSTL